MFVFSLFTFPKNPTIFQNRGENSGTSNTRTSNVLPDLLTQASPATPPRHDKSSSEEVRFFVYVFILENFPNHLRKINFDATFRFNWLVVIESEEQKPIKKTLIHTHIHTHTVNSLTIVQFFPLTEMVFHSNKLFISSWITFTCLWLIYSKFYHFIPNVWDAIISRKKTREHS